MILLLPSVVVVSIVIIVVVVLIDVTVVIIVVIIDVFVVIIVIIVVIDVVVLLSSSFSSSVGGIWFLWPFVLPQDGLKVTPSEIQSLAFSSALLFLERSRFLRIQRGARAREGPLLMK